MAIIKLPCPCNNTEITGKVKVVKKGFPTGQAAEQAAIDEALTSANRDAQNATRGCRCQAPCDLTFKKPPKIKVRTSGSQINPEFELVGLAVVIWRVYPTCTKVPVAGNGPGVAKKPPRPPKPIRGPVDTPLPPIPTANPYPFSKTIPCGKVMVHIAVKGEPDDPKGGSIIFEFQKNATPSDACNCENFGWIQHVQVGGGEWRYDNGAKGGGIANPRRYGALSDPTLPVQPLGPDNPWYGAWSGAPPDPPGFDQDPKPQPRIGDKPKDVGTSYVTQLVCIPTGDVLFAWYWGPITSKTRPLSQVPAGTGHQRVLELSVRDITSD